MSIREWIADKFRSPGERERRHKQAIMDGELLAATYQYLYAETPAIRDDAVRKIDEITTGGRE